MFMVGFRLENSSNDVRRAIEIAIQVAKEMREREDKRHHVSASVEVIRNSLQYQPDTYHR